MRIVLHEITYKNFQAVGNQPITIRLDSHNTTLVIGANGVGKTGIMQAVTAALYGKSLSNLINKPELINHTNGKDCELSISFTVNSDSYVVNRGMKPNFLKIEKNGSLIPALPSLNEMQTLLEDEILQLDFRAYSHIVMINSRNYTPFLRLTADNKRKFIDDIYNLDVLVSMKDVIKKKMDDFSNKNKTYDKSISALEVDLSRLTGKISGIEETILNESSKENEDIVENLNNEIEKLSEELRNLDKSINEKTLELQKVNVKDSEDIILETSGIITNLISKNKELEDQKRFFESNKTCFTCTQPIEQKFSLTKINEYSSTISENKDDIDFAHDLKNKHRIMKENFTKISNEIDDFRYKKRSIEVKIKGYENNIKVLNEKKDNNIKIMKENISSLTLEKEEIENKLKDIHEKSDRLLSEYSDYQVVSNMLKDSGIKSMIMRKYVSEFSSIVNHYLTRFGSGLYIEFDENFDAILKQDFINEQSYHAFSEGEKIRIDTSIMFAWRKVCERIAGVSFNVLFLDEISDSSADDPAVTIMFETIKSLASTNVFVISHSQSLIEETFDRVFRVSRNNGFTEITLEKS